MKIKLLLFAIVWQIILCDLVCAASSTGAEIEYIPSSNNFGIGTKTPTTKLDVNGEIMIRAGSPAVGKILSSDKNGKAAWVLASSLISTDANTLDTFDSLQFLRSDITNNFSSGILSTDAGTRFDINGDLSIADTNIVLDGANTSFTQSSGNISLNPASNKDLSLTITSAGEFKINTNDFIFNGTNARIGIGTANPNTKLDVNGTIKGLVINGTNANFTDITSNSINISGPSNFSKILVSNNANGSTANFNTGNFTDLIVSGTINGTNFDGDFANGSVLFSNNQGVISQSNAHLFWDRVNNRLAVKLRSPNEILTVNGVVAIKESSAPSATSSFGKLFVNPITHHLYFMNQSGSIYSLINGTTAAITDANTLDTLDSSQFLRSNSSTTYTSGTLTFDPGTSFDINSTDVSIADPDITLDGANTSFTQSTGDISLVPASGKDLSTTISGDGEFKINTSDFVFNGTNARVGIGTANPRAKLDVNGTIFGTTINGTNANFTNLTVSSLTNTGTTNFSKIIVANNTNGTTGNFTTGNFNNIVINGIINGSTTSFDGDFTNGSVLFSNNQGVISQDNSYFYWDKHNKKLALNHSSPDMPLDVNGAIAFRHPTSSAGGAGPAPVYKSYASNSASMYGTSVSVAMPSGVALNNILVAFTYALGAPIILPTPSGWTSIGERVSWDGYYKIAGFYKISDGSTSNQTFSCGGSILYCSATILRYANGDTSNPINTYQTSNGISANVVAPSVTTSSDNTAIIRAIVSSNDEGSESFSGYPAGHTGVNYTDEMGQTFANAVTTQVSAGATGTASFTFNRYSPPASWAAITVAINASSSAGSSDPSAPDSGAATIWLANSDSNAGEIGDIISKITASSATKTIRITDFENGTLIEGPDADSLDGIDSSSFLRSNSSDNYTSGTLTFNGGTTLSLNASSTLDINSTNLSIADTNISLDGATTTFTQSSGDISLVPATDLNLTLASGGKFRINTSDLVFESTNSRVGIGTANPSAKLDVNGTIKGNPINGTSANFTNIYTSKLISLGVVNGATVNFSNGNFAGTMNTTNLIASGSVNGTTANFTNANFPSISSANSTFGTLSSTTINNSGDINSGKLISSGVINGTTANLSKVLASGSVNGTNANFTNVTISGTINGTNFDGNFTNGSILFSNNDGIISEDNNQLFWNRSNNNLALGLTNPNEKLTINGNLALAVTSVPSSTSGFGKFYATGSNLYFQNDSGISYNVANGNLAGQPNASGADTNFQFNNNGTLAGNGALSFTRANKTLQIPANASLDINSTDVSIADNDISFDSATGVTFTPSAGQNLNIALSGAGDFTVNNNQIYLDSSTAKLGLMTNNPNELLSVNGNLSLTEGVAPSTTSNFGKLYIKSTDSKLYFKNDSGTESDLTSSSSINLINDLSDAITNNSSSIFMGNNSGVNIDPDGWLSRWSTALGVGTLQYNTTGYANTAMGYQALNQNFNGTNNSAFGYKALYSNTLQHYNTAIGANSLYSATGGNVNNGSVNTAIGAESLYSSKLGSNTAFGYQALRSTINGQDNVAFGTESLYSNISGNGNVAVGDSSLRSNTSGFYNTAIGHESLYSTKDNNYNIGLGYHSLYNLKHGDNNLAIGTGAISALVNGSNNIALGFDAGKRATPNPANLYTSNGIHIGYNAGLNDGGDNNIMIGFNVSNGDTITGSNNILFGSNNSLPSSSASNQLDIADTIYGDLANHKVGIGTASIDTKLEVNGTTMVNIFANKAFYSNNSGSNVTIDWNNGNKQKITLGQNVTFAFTAPNSGVGSFVLKLTQDGTGSRTAIWPASVKWPNGNTPLLSTAPGYTDLVGCVYTGSIYLCQMGLDFR